MTEEPFVDSYSVEFWNCGQVGHHHKTRDAAEKCSSARNKPKKLAIDQSGRNLEILRDVASGVALSEVARKHGVSQQIVRNVVNGLYHLLTVRYGYVLRAMPIIRSPNEPLTPTFRGIVADLRRHPEEWIARFDMMAEQRKPQS